MHSFTTKRLHVLCPQASYTGILRPPGPDWVTSVPRPLKAVPPKFIVSANCKESGLITGCQTRFWGVRQDAPTACLMVTIRSLEAYRRMDRCARGPVSRPPATNDESTTRVRWRTKWL